LTSNLDSAKYYFELVLEYSKMPDNQLEVSYAHSGLGNVYFKSGYPSGAIFHHKTALELRKEIPDKRLITSSYLDISDVYSGIGLYKTSYSYIDSSFVLINQTDTKDLLVNYWFKKAKIDSSSNNFKSAYISI
jgi:tetratricopeptide (TPR) repeat protein